MIGHVGPNRCGALLAVEQDVPARQPDAAAGAGQQQRVAVRRKRIASGPASSARPCRSWVMRGLRAGHAGRGERPGGKAVVALGKGPEKRLQPAWPLIRPGAELSAVIRSPRPARRRSRRSPSSMSASVAGGSVPPPQPSRARPSTTARTVCGIAVVAHPVAALAVPDVKRDPPRSGRSGRRRSRARAALDTEKPPSGVS